MARNILITGPAKTDIHDIWWNGIEQYNRKIADDYGHLIRQAIKDLSEAPDRAGTRKVKDRNDGLYRYRIEYSKKRAQVTIGKPAHAIFYYVFEEAIVISRIMREARGFEITRITPP